MSPDHRTDKLAIAMVAVVLIAVLVALGWLVL
jgi:hypothetical protein